MPHLYSLPLAPTIPSAAPAETKTEIVLPGFLPQPIRIAGTAACSHITTAVNFAPAAQLPTFGKASLPRARKRLGPFIDLMARCSEIRR